MKQEVPVALKLVRVGVDGGKLVGPAVVCTAVIPGSDTGTDGAPVAASEVVDKLGKHGSPVSVELSDDGIDL